MSLLDGIEGTEGIEGMGSDLHASDADRTSTSDGMNRRRFLKVLGVTGGGAAALSGCSTENVEKLIPYLVPPENQVPGIATYYASTCRECPAGCGLHVKVREGRAIKLEGNPDHPVNRGKLCSRGQAGLQGLYNPDRVREPMAKAADGTWQPITWEDALGRVTAQLSQVAGERVWFLTGQESGSFSSLIDSWMSGLGSRNRVVYEPLAYEALRHANQQIFGVDALPRYDFAAAHVVVSFGTDFLETWLSPVEHARGFATGHAFHDGRMGKYIHVEPRMSMTGMSADEWIAPVPGTEALLAIAMEQTIVSERLTTLPADASRLQALLSAHAPEAVAERCGVPAETIRRVAREFAAERSVAVAGGMAAQHAEAHVTAAAVNVLNYVAGNIDRTVFPAARPSTAAYRNIGGLINAMSDGRVGVLFVHGVNPTFSTPASAGFAGALDQVPFTVSFARFMDETAAQADLILPDHDPLEQWNDSEPRAGVHLLQQPVMQPVFNTRQTGDVLIQVAKQAGGRLAAAVGPDTYKAYLEQAWAQLQRRLGDRSDFPTFWNTSLQAGGVWREPTPPTTRLARSADAFTTASVWAAPSDGFTLIAYPSPGLYDGRGANRPWLQELPDPVSKITWGTWVEIHPETAKEHDIRDGEIVEVTTSGGVVQAPAFLYPGIRRDAIAMPLGQGHTNFGRYANGRGTNVYSVLSSDPTGFGGLSFYSHATLRHLYQYERPATNAGKSRQMGRGIAQAVTLGELTGAVEPAHDTHADHAAPVPEHIEHVLDEWQEAQYREQDRGDYAGDQPRWGMAIDLSRCTGCSACMTACHAENNIPTVGPELMRRGRDMSWIRIERYFEGGEHDEPFESRVVPMLCQHCGNAPCEPVCPVYAAYHTPDGLNAQVYNRCVGTRYCGNNCPYKVRYFNWFEFSDPDYAATHAWPEPLNWLLNPDVTVRSKGVMEKCTFCVQRIRGKQNEAALDNRALRDGEVMTACQQTCPSDAIVFGDMNDPNSRVSQVAAGERHYHVLESLNTRPAITYLKKVRNAEAAH